MERGTYKFEVSDDVGDLINNATNVNRLRKLWLDRRLIKGDDLGPGDPGDFDHGAWHVACHLAAACGVRQRADGNLAWLQISHDDRADRYFASVTVLEGGKARTVPTEFGRRSRPAAGDTPARFSKAPHSDGRRPAMPMIRPNLFNLWRRQDFDQPTNSEEDGGRVWEQWCAQRDIRATHAIGTSVLTAFVALVAALGDLFIPTVARGRKEYGHPEQLRAMIRTGLVDRKSALWDGTPTAISSNAEKILEEADPIQPRRRRRPLSIGRIRRATTCSRARLPAGTRPPTSRRCFRPERASVAPKKTATRRQASNGLLRGSRVYLSGPMDFAASRDAEQKQGWRTRIGRVLREAGAVVFDPWNKPQVRGLHGYGEETAESTRAREAWTFENSQPARRRARN